LILTLGLVHSSDLIISRHLGRESTRLVLALPNDLGLSFTHAYHHHHDPADACPTLLGPLL
jgi:hypothetical protein